MHGVGMNTLSRWRIFVGPALSAFMALSLVAGPAAGQDDTGTGGVLGGVLGGLLTGRTPSKPKAPKPPAAVVPPAADQGRAAYDMLCARGDLKLSPTTCAAMKRDLDQAATNDASAAYRDLCAPGAEKFSKATCAAMRLDAGPAPIRNPAARSTDRTPAIAAPSPAPTRAAELGDAYAELCAGPEPQLSAATCASLKSDAAKAPVSAPSRVSPKTAPIVPRRPSPLAKPGFAGVSFWTDAKKIPQIAALTPGGGAAKAGLRVGDLFQSAGDVAVTTSEDFLDQVHSRPPGATMSFQVKRGEKLINGKLVLGTPPPAPPAPARVLPVNWGGMDLLAGHTYVKRKSRFITDLDYVRSFHWSVPGRVLVEDWNIEGSTGTGTYGLTEYDGVLQPFAIENGTIIMADADGTRVAMRVFDAYRFETTTEQKKGGVWKVMLMGRSTFESTEARQQAASSGPSMWGAVLQGAIIGATGGELPAMREDGSMPNMLDTLNSANARLQQQNAEGKARLDATIAAAQAQGRRAQAPAAQSLPLANQPARPTTPPPGSNAAGGGSVTFYAWCVAGGDSINNRIYSSRIGSRSGLPENGGGWQQDMAQAFRAYLASSGQAGGENAACFVKHTAGELQAFKSSENGYGGANLVEAPWTPR